MKIREFLYHFANGINSGIPLCCVWFFCTKNNKYPAGIGATLDEIRGDCSRNYVACHRCFAEGIKIEPKINGPIFRWLIK